MRLKLRGLQMEKDFGDLTVKRRSIYQLGNKEVLSKDEVIALIEQMVRNCPTAFNSQSGRVVVLFGEENQRFWCMTAEILKKEVPDAAYEKTAEKIASFAAGYGTVLYFIDEVVTKELQEKFPLYADNFPIWAEQANGMLQYMVWTALAEKNIGASLQHYNPLIDSAVHKEWNVPKNWQLRAEMPFGNIEVPAGEKTYLSIEERMKVYQ